MHTERYGRASCLGNLGRSMNFSHGGKIHRGKEGDKVCDSIIKISCLFVGAVEVRGRGRRL